MAIASLCLVLTACGGGGERPDPLPSLTPTASAIVATASPTPTPTRTGPLLTGPGVSPGETPPTLPAVDLQKSNAGALGFAVYFFRALNWSFATTDPYLIQEWSSSTCARCSSYIDNLSDLGKAGGHIEGGRLTISSANIVTGTLVEADYVVRVTLSQSALVVISPPAPPSSASTQHLNAMNDIYLSWASGTWSVLGIAVAG